MAAPTETYVDPAIAAASGSGTVGDPYGDLQHALDTMTRDATNGDRLNIKAGTDEILAAALDLTTYGTPTQAAPLIFQGYTSAAGDGGVGGISGNGSVSVINSAVYDYVHFVDLHLHNTGANPIVLLDNFCSIVNCELDNCTDAAIDIDNYCLIVGNNVHNVTSGANTSTGTIVESNYFTNLTNAVTSAAAGKISRNIISLAGGSRNGIFLSNNHSGPAAVNNTILAAGSAGYGIRFAGNSELIWGNVIEGFSGVGGQGLYLSAAGSKLAVVNYNAVFNCTTAYDFAAASGDYHHLGSSLDNETLGSSPFAKSGADTFANRFTYFRPNDVGNVLETALSQHKGAVVPSAAASGGPLVGPSAFISG